MGGERGECAGGGREEWQGLASPGNRFGLGVRAEMRRCFGWSLDGFGVWSLMRVRWQVSVRSEGSLPFAVAVF